MRSSTRSRRRHFGVALLAGLALALGIAASAGASGFSLVTLGHHRATFGHFSDARSSSDGKELTRVFGRPSHVKRSESFLCTKTWNGRGIKASLALFGEASGDPCRRGIFLEARLTKRRWHTKTHVHPGSRASFVKHHSVKRCTPARCGVRGYALELHHVDCSAGRVPGVIAQIPKGRKTVSALVVRWRGCE